MNTPDPLAEFFAASPRQSPGLGGRSGIQGQVDAALNELQVPATLDKDGDWKLQTDVGPFLLLVDKEASDLVAIQTMRPVEAEADESADEMRVLMALNYAARGIARFGVVKDDQQNLLVLSARLAPDEVSTDAVGRMLRDCFRLSRRLDDLLGREPAQPDEAVQPAGDGSAAEPNGSQETAGGAETAQEPADEAIASAADVTRMASPIPEMKPPGEPEPAGESASPAPGAQPAPQAQPPGAQPAPQAQPPAAYPAPAAQPAPVAQPQPALQPEPVAQPAPVPPAPVQPAPVAPQPAPVAPQPAPVALQPAPVVQPAPVAPQPPPQAQLPPANWYPDPHRQARLRYWDGQRWTQHVAN